MSTVAAPPRGAGDPWSDDPARRPTSPERPRTSGSSGEGARVSLPQIVSAPVNASPAMPERTVSRSSSTTLPMVAGNPPTNASQTSAAPATPVEKAQPVVANVVSGPAPLEMKPVEASGARSSGGSEHASNRPPSSGDAATRTTIAPAESATVTSSPAQGAAPPSAETSARPEPVAEQNVASSEAPRPINPHPPATETNNAVASTAAAVVPEPASASNAAPISTQAPSAIANTNANTNASNAPPTDVKPAVSTATAAPVEHGAPPPARATTAGKNDGPMSPPVKKSVSFALDNDTPPLTATSTTTTRTDEPSRAAGTTTTTARKDDAVVAPTKPVGAVAELKDEEPVGVASASAPTRLEPAPASQQHASSAASVRDAEAKSPARAREGPAATPGSPPKQSSVPLREPVNNSRASAGVPASSHASAAPGVTLEAFTALAREVELLRQNDERRARELKDKSNLLTLQERRITRLEGEIFVLRDRLRMDQSPHVLEGTMGASMTAAQAALMTGEKAPEPVDPSSPVTPSPYAAVAAPPASQAALNAREAEAAELRRILFAVMDERGRLLTRLESHESTVRGLNEQVSGLNREKRKLEASNTGLQSRNRSLQDQLRLNALASPATQGSSDAPGSSTTSGDPPRKDWDFTSQRKDIKAGVRPPSLFHGPKDKDKQRKPRREPASPPGRTMLKPLGKGAARSVSPSRKDGSPGQRRALPQVGKTSTGHMSTSPSPSPSPYTSMDMDMDEHDEAEAAGAAAEAGDGEEEEF